jgi:hypothetical protein
MMKLYEIASPRNREISIQYSAVATKRKATTRRRRRRGTA